MAKPIRYSAAELNIQQTSLKDDWLKVLNYRILNSLWQSPTKLILWLWTSHPRLTQRILNLAGDQTQKYCYQVELDFLFPRFKNVQLFCFQKTKQSCVMYIQFDIFQNYIIIKFVLINLFKMLSLTENKSLNYFPNCSSMNDCICFAQEYTGFPTKDETVKTT